MRAAEEGLSVTYQGRSYRNVADLHFLYARALWLDTKERQQEEVKEVCAQRCILAYVSYQFDGDAKAEAVKKYMMEELEWQFTI